MRSAARALGNSLLTVYGSAAALLHGFGQLISTRSK